MKAAVRYRYGPPSELRIEDVPEPSIGKSQVLVRVKAVSLNASDVEFMTGRPAYARIFGLARPRFPILGTDVTGVVEAVGSGVSEFRVGDEVMGDMMSAGGALCELCSVPAKFLQKKPPGVSFVDASTFPQAGAITFQGLGRVKAGKSVLINGAGGGSGGFGIQLAKSLGARVTGVDNARKLEFMRSLGADEVVDYQREDFTKRSEKYDWILDYVATRSLAAIESSLLPGGSYQMVGGHMKVLFQTLLFGWTASEGRNVKVLGVKQNHGVAEMLSLYQAGTLNVTVDRVFPLDEAPEALRRVADGEALGKVVVVVSE